MTQSELQARVLELQAHLERNLAEQQTDPAVRRMIENSAVGKEEKAIELRTGRKVEQSRYERRTEQSHPFPVKWAIRSY